VDQTRTDVAWPGPARRGRGLIRTHRFGGDAGTVRVPTRPRRRVVSGLVAAAALLVAGGTNSPSALVATVSPTPIRNGTAQPGSHLVPHAVDHLLLHPVPTPAAAAQRAVVALGDSVTAGADCDCTAFPVLYARRLASRDSHVVTVANLGAGGLTAHDLLEALRRDDSTESAVRAADTVVVTIGANDLGDVKDRITAGSCAGPERTTYADDDLRRLGDDVRDLLARIDDIRSHRPTQVLVTGYWNVFEDGGVAARMYSAEGRAASVILTRRVNALLHDRARAARDTWVDLDARFTDAAGTDRTSLLADDGDHPDAAGHQAIAKALIDATPWP